MGSAVAKLVNRCNSYEELTGRPKTQNSSLDEILTHKHDATTSRLEELSNNKQGFSQISGLHKNSNCRDLNRLSTLLPGEWSGIDKEHRL